MNYLALIAAVLLFSSCRKHHTHTAAFCNKALYVETFAVSPFGVNTDYLTDSLTFRRKIGTWDTEHETFLYTCRQGNIQVVKLRYGEKNCRLVTLPDKSQTIHCDTQTVERKAYDLHALQQNHTFD